MALALFGCGAADEVPADENDSLEAVLTIERVEDAGRIDDPSASAMAQFVILPSEADVHATLGAAGLRSQLPEQPGCTELALGELGPRWVSASTASFREPLELLEAGDVSIQADGTVTQLALNLFPPSGSASGVIYTTPDQSAAPLPPDAGYAIVATGSGVIPPLTIQGWAPGSLADVTVRGVPLEQAQALAAGQPLDLTWREGAAGDRVYVELSDGEHDLACAFADEEGSGTVPAPLMARLSPGSPVRLSVHRVREAVRGEAPGVDDLSLETTVRFDFEVTSALRVE